MAVAAVAAMVVGVIAGGGGVKDGEEALAGAVPSVAVEVASAATALQPSPGAVTARGVPQPCEAVVEVLATSAINPSALALARQKVANRLAGGDTAQRTLALLLQAPPIGDTVQRAGWAAQVMASALASSDALALRTAASACPHVTDAGRCRLQLIQYRIALDPGNALPWVEWLDEAPMTADAAWAGLAAATHWHDEPQLLAAKLDEALDPDLPAPLRTTLLAEAAALDADRPIATLSVLQNQCGHWGPGHPLGIACAHGVALMLANTNSPRTALDGAALARGMGWDEENLVVAEVRARRLLESAQVNLEHGCRPSAGLHTDKPH